MARWLNDFVDTLPFERRRPQSTGLGAGSLGLLALGLGAGLMYFFDPELGYRRRAAFRTALGDLRRRTGEALDDASRDVARRARAVGVVRSATPPEAQLP
ncbi:MAG: hypothetical protein ACREJ9_02830 [Candidatus Rokuibacteriota bacterium]